MALKLDWYLQINLKARQLHLLIALADLGNLTKVAAAIHVSVPAVSKALAELEHGIGLELFTRTPHGLRPTIYGECLIRHARSMLVNLQHARDELKFLSAGSGGKVNVGVYPASTSVLIPRALVLLKQNSTGANALIAEGTNATLLPKLWEGSLDLVVGRLPVVPSSSGFESKILLDEELRVVAGPNHPLAQRERVQWSDLRGYPWVLPPVASMKREAMEHVLAENGIESEKSYIETASLHVTKAYLHLTDAIAVMANAAAHGPTEPLAVLPLTLPPVLRPVGVMWNRNQALSPVTQLMLDCLDQAASDMREQEAEMGSRSAS